MGSIPCLDTYALTVHKFENEKVMMMTKRIDRRIDLFNSARDDVLFGGAPNAFGVNISTDKSGDPVQTIRFDRPEKYLWKPKKDITTYELARAMCILMDFRDYEKYGVLRTAVKTLPRRVRRHFVKI